MRLVCISDLHSYHPSPIPDGDVLIIAGDICDKGNLLEIFAYDDLFGDLPHPHTLVIAGNHDWPFVHMNKEQKHKLFNHATYLEDEGVEIDGVKFWGSPWQPTYFDWAFNLPRGPKLAEVWAKIPSDTDVLITHGPPFGILDTVKTGEHVGCEELSKALLQIKPKVHVFGHIHESYGALEKHGTTYINACLCNAHYQPENSPIVVDL